MNRVEIIGRIGQDLEVKKTRDGKSVLEFSLADKEKDNTTWINCQAWESVAETIAKYSLKGDMIFIAGKLKHIKYEVNGETKNKSFVQVKEFQFLPNKRERAEEKVHQYSLEDSREDREFNNKFGGNDYGFNQDELPF